MSIDVFIDIIIGRYICQASSVKSRSRVSRYIGWVTFYYRSTGQPTIGHESIGSALVMYRWAIRRVLVSVVYQSTTDNACKTLFFSNFVLKAFPFVTRYLSTDTHGNFFAHYTYRLWLISASSDTKSQSIFMYRPTSPSSVGWQTCTGCYIGWESVNSWLTDTSNDSRLRFRPLCQLSVSDKLVIRRQSNDWLSTNRL